MVVSWKQSGKQVTMAVEEGATGPTSVAGKDLLLSPTSSRLPQVDTPRVLRNKMGSVPIQVDQYGSNLSAGAAIANTLAATSVTKEVGHNTGVAGGYKEEVLELSKTPLSKQSLVEELEMDLGLEETRPVGSRQGRGIGRASRRGGQAGACPHHCRREPFCRACRLCQGGCRVNRPGAAGLGQGQGPWSWEGSRPW